MRFSNKRDNIFALFILVFTIGCSKGGTNDGISPPPTDTVPNKNWIVSTVAGTGVAGYVNGKDTAAQFNFPHSIAVDFSGNLFVSDVQNFAIRKISNGQVTTLSDRQISNADPMFGHTYGVVLDNQNNVYNIQYGLIYKISLSGSASIFAGNLAHNLKDGQDTAARFNELMMIARDIEGNFYLPDYDLQANFFIRKVSPTGLVSTLSLKDNTGYSSGSTPNHFYVGPIALDKNGNIYFVANGNSIIKKADPLGNVSILAGAGNIGFTDGKGRDAQFNGVLGMICDTSNNLYVTDYGNGAVRKITPDGTVTTIAGSTAGPGFKDGKGSVAQFKYPTGIAMDKNGILYVADAGNYRIRKLEYK
jgi:hypothetical protein